MALNSQSPIPNSHVNPTKSDKDRGNFNFSGGKRTKKTKANFIETFIETNFHIGFACKQVGINRDSYYRWMEKDPEFKKAIENALEYRIDEYETLLAKQAYSGDTSAITFFLKTKAKHRGYEEKHSVEHSGKIDNKIELEIIEVIKKEDEAEDDDSVQKH